MTTRPTTTQRRQISTLDGFKSEPTPEQLNRIEEIYTEEGFLGVTAIQASGLPGRSWEVKVFADNNPYE